MIRLILILWGFSFIARMFFSHHVNEIFGQVDILLYKSIAAIPVFLSKIWFLVATILYFTGIFMVLVLLALGIFMVVYTVVLNWNQFEQTTEGLYEFIKILLKENIALPGVTILVAATVAVGHMWKLNLDRKQYFENKEREFRERYERIAAEQKKRRKKLSDPA